jgi:uncharacterized membrane protein YedE/YeeE
MEKKIPINATSTASSNLELDKKSSSQNKSRAGIKSYWNPYIAGLGLGLTLLAAFLLMGRGLGASGAFTSFVSVGVNVVAPQHAQSNGLYSSYLENDEHHPLNDWLVFEILGVILGGFISGWVARRISWKVEKGPRISSAGRLFFAFSGGVMMGFAAKMARGCTSGQALTGGAVMSPGSWIFMISVFIGGYAMAYFIRRQWT